MNAPSLLANKYPFLISLPHFVQTILDSSIKFTKKAALKIHIRKISTASLRLSYNIISYLLVTLYYSNRLVTCQVFISLSHSYSLSVYDMVQKALRISIVEDFHTLLHCITRLFLDHIF